MWLKNLRFLHFDAGKSIGKGICPDAPNVGNIYLYTLGEKWPHSKGNVGKHSLHGAFGMHTGFSTTLHNKWPALF